MEYLGKKKCRVLKDIRKQIADANDIQYAPNECTHQGDCPGTCPKCEQEVRYIESELAKKQKMGKKITIAAAIGSMIVSASALTSCNSNSSSESHETTGAPIKEEVDSDSLMINAPIDTTDSECDAPKEQLATPKHNKVRELEVYMTEGDVSVPPTVDSSMVGQERTVHYGKTWGDTVTITLTPDMIGETYLFPEKGSAVWKAAKAAREQRNKETNK